MESESRSIDTAQNASIDLMTLNKKVVNMRAIVRRSKTHIINKLTRNIADLKKKKGSEEEKKKNLEKAQRYLNEIQSIRSLKEDKVSKYSIANVSTFEEVSKSTLAPGARALARLADQQFIKEAVQKFREDHSDWRDLAAFMLMQQTGRKFKSQKKGKKHVTRAENINASKLMTEAYTQGLFREEGSQMVKEPPKKKRRKKAESKESEGDVDNSTEGKESLIKDKDSENSEDDGDEDKQEQSNKDVLKNIQERMLNIADKDHIPGLSENKSENKYSSQNINDERVVTNDKTETQSENTQFSPRNVDKSSKRPVESRPIINQDAKEKQIEEEEEEAVESSEEEMEDDSASDQDSEAISEDVEESENESDSHPETSQAIEKLEEPPKRINKKNKECVVKQLDINSDDDSNGDSSDGSEDESSEEDENEEDSEEEGEEEEESNNKKRGKSIPDFITKGQNKGNRLPRDPFFEGSDMEDEGNYGFEDDGDYDGGDDDDCDIGDKFKGNKKTTKSLFHQPGDERRSFERTGFSGRGGTSGGRGSGSGGRGRGRGGYQDRMRDRPSMRGGHSFGNARGRGSYKFGDNKFKPEFNNSRRDFPKTPESAKAGFTKKEESSVPSPKPAEKLHPSWEASRKRKAEQGGGIKAFAGTKITFNDDD